METNQRIFGLDLIRVTAIVMILMAQCIWILPQSGSAVVTQVASLFHFMGLEIFFVLSGFLLGNSMYKLLMKDDFGSHSVLHFLKKRAIRILPLYYLVLAINFGIARHIGYPVEQGWKYIVLLQNFASPIPAFFSESWGLPIIVFDGVLFPLVLLGFNAIFKPKNKSGLFFIVALFLIAIFLISKFIYNATTPNTDVNQWYADLKPVVIYRLDAVIIGILFSWLLNNIAFFRKSRLLLAFIGGVGIGFIFVGVGYFQLLIESHPFFWNVIYLPMASLSIAFFLPLLCAWKNSFAATPIRFLSAITYAVYMVHFGIVLQLMKFYFPVAVPKQWLLFVISYLTITFILGFLLNRLCQKIFIKRLPAQ